MYKVYFKQALALLRQNKLVSTISIMGTAFAIMIIMSFILLDRMQHADIKPEKHRSRTLYIRFESRITTQYRHGGNVTFQSVKNYLSRMKTPEKTGIIASRDREEYRALIGRPNSLERTVHDIAYVDAGYWEILSFDFLKGKAFNQRDYEGGVKYAVVSQGVADKYFGKEAAVGKELEIDFISYKVVGVVKEVPTVFNFAYSEVWIPATSVAQQRVLEYDVLLLAKNRNDFDAISDEIRECEKRWNAENAPWTITYRGPYTHRAQMLQTWYAEPDMKNYIVSTLFFFLIILIVPVLNLSGFSKARIERRKAEIGVRRSFGAKKSTVLIQVLYDNMITSIIGGVLGLLLAYLILWIFRGWLLETDTIPIRLLVSGSVFVVVFLVTLLINLLSAGIPAYRASRMKIIDSLK